MKNKKYINLCNNILNGLSSLICLEDENGNHLLSNRKRSRIGKIQRIEYQPDYPYLIADPRINFIKRILKMILNRGVLANNNHSVNPFAFRLKRLKDWLATTTSQNLLSQMSWACKANCIFCYLKGNPSFMRQKKRISKEEIKTRLKYFDAIHNLGLVGGVFYETDEILTNPYITEILKEIRKKDRHKIMHISTNGTSLTPKMVKTLAQAKPLLLVVSLNSADPKIRKWLMNDPHPEVAIASLPLLKKYKIPFVVSVVVWPDIPFSDIVKTIHYAEKNDAYFVLLYTPDYSRFFSKNKLFDARAYAIKVAKYFHPLSKKIKVPILIDPHTIVQNHIYNRADLPKIVGIIKNSPAFNCGIKPDDLIKEINGQPIDSIEEAVNMLFQNLHHKVKIKIERNNTVFELEIKDKPRDYYPYSLKELRQITPIGFLLPNRYLPQDAVKEIGHYITVYGKKNVLVLTSAGAQPILKHLLKKHNTAKISGANIRIVTTKNHYFGGSIDCANLLMVEDFIKAIKQNLKKIKPDLIALPASPFSAWWRDIIGRIALDIEREVGIPVVFIYNG